ncbi:HK97-gp10 family putative phage morphogenesis protein [Companilactobacillus kedongensis]|uniref:HK97-gp10 family putative phage morphogenesis protein n=1 Tax=Companilactobacillus kedongensis TaxID=2486004 RepID=UPI000F77B40B|nr:HK97-gp10 family putative phage morphogenesis protein [Companilactobacillus kedongensis]
MSFNISDDVTSKLSSLGNKGNTIRNKSLRAGRDIVVNNLENNTPYENSSDRSWKGQREMDKVSGHKTVFKHMKDDIVYSGVDSQGAVKVGFGKDTFWRVHFVELGTIHQAANPFIESTLKDSESEYKQVIEETARNELGL